MKFFLLGGLVIGLFFLGTSVECQEAAAQYEGSDESFYSVEEESGSQPRSFHVVDIPDEENIDLARVLGDFFEAEDDDDDQEIDEESSRDGRSKDEPSETAVLSDPAVISKYNNFVDAFLRQLSSSIKGRSDPMTIVLRKNGKVTGLPKGNKGSKRQEDLFEQEDPSDDEVEEDRSPTSRIPNKANHSKKVRRQLRRKNGVRHPKDLSFPEDEAATENLTGERTEDDDPRGVEVSEDDAELAVRKRRAIEDEEYEDDGDFYYDEEEEEEVDGRTGKALTFDEEDVTKREGKALTFDEEDVTKREGKALTFDEEDVTEREGKALDNGENELENLEDEEDEDDDTELTEEEGKSLSMGNTEVEEARGDSKDDVEGRQRRRGKRGKRRRRKGGRGRRRKKCSKKCRRRRRMRRRRNRNRGKRSLVGSTAILTGLSLIRREGDVRVVDKGRMQHVHAEVEVGPVTLTAEKSFGEGDEVEQRRSEATAESVKGKLMIAITKEGEATVKHFRIFKPAAVSVSGSLRLDNSESSNQFMENYLAKASPFVSRRVKAAANKVLAISQNPNNKKSNNKNNRRGQNNRKNANKE